MEGKITLVIGYNPISIEESCGVCGQNHVLRIGGYWKFRESGKPVCLDCLVALGVVINVEGRFVNQLTSPAKVSIPDKHQRIHRLNQAFAA